MKKIVLTLLAVIVLLGLLAATGFAGYRIGYAQGAQGAQRTTDGQMPGVRPFDGMGPNRMPMQSWGEQLDRDFDRGFGPRGFPMQGFGFFAPLRFLGQLLVLGLIIWFIYWMFTRSGWQLTRRTVQIVETQAKPEETEVKE